LGIKTDILLPEVGNTDYRSKSYFRICGARLRKPCQNHLKGPNFLDLFVLFIEYLQASLLNAIENIAVTFPDRLMQPTHNLGLVISFIA
jgi:hypothetical protein